MLGRKQWTAGSHSQVPLPLLASTLLIHYNLAPCESEQSLQRLYWLCSGRARWASTGAGVGRERSIPRN